MKKLWGYGSVGRAPRSQRGGQGFDSPYLHQEKPKSNHFASIGFLFFTRKYKIVLRAVRFMYEDLATVLRYTKIANQ